ncbi:M48 family metallopeptidase [Niveibacterium sp. SC-1]|uniref:M48 family metallopeptidase n=1 Tax=Niveibacterium sp. SC-1 TaxID=3135646 RepID=UPI00311F4CE2
MTQQEFRRLVARLERECDATPGPYRLKVMALAALGYAYVISILAIAAAALVWGVSLISGGHHLFAGAKLGLFGGAVGFLLVRALWVRLDPPTGRRLTAADTPKLFEMIGKILKREKGPKIHEVLVTDEFNAAIVQTPRFGIFGGYRNTLIVGLALMQAMTPKEFAAVVAHEYGHISGSHGKSGAWVYRIRLVWMRLYETFQQESDWFDKLFTRFFRWFIPYFNAYSFVLARQQEYEADRASARLVGSAVAAQALVASSVRGRFMGEKFWPGLYAQADRLPRPGFLPHATLRTAFRLGASEEDNARWLKEAMARRTDIDDTHPCLRDRLDALGEKAVAPGPLDTSAARYFLGESLAAIVEAFDREWLEGVQKDWAERHTAVRAAEARLDAARGKDPKRMEVEELTPYALALNTLGRKEEALPLLRQAAEHSRGSAEVAMQAALLMLDADDADAIRYLELAMDRDGDLIREATWRAWQFFDARGDEEQASYWGDRLERVSAD